VRADLRRESGFMLVELLVAAVVLSIAILAMMAVYDASFISLHKAAQKTAAATLAQNQLELFRALSYDSIGLDSSSLTTAQANSTYSGDESGLTPSGGTDVTLASSCSETQCLPIQTLTGSDHRGYLVETFVRDIDDLGYAGRPERLVTIIVRDPSTSGSPVVAELGYAFDQGPADTTTTVVGSS